MATAGTWSAAELKQHLRNMTVGTRMVTKRLEELPLDTPFEDAMIQSLLAFHPRFEEKKLIDMQHLILQKGVPFRNTITLFFKTRDGVRDDVSYKQCIRNLFGKFDSQTHTTDRVAQAFRNAVRHQVDEFKATSHKTCARCGDDSADCWHVDHYNKPFVQLVQEFMLEEGIDAMASIELVRSETNGVADALLADEGLRMRWEDYHSKHASLRMACKRCNLSLGKHGFTKSASR